MAVVKTVLFDFGYREGPRLIGFVRRPLTEGTFLPLTLLLRQSPDLPLLCRDRSCCRRSEPVPQGRRAWSALAGSSVFSPSRLAHSLSMLQICSYDAATRPARPARSSRSVSHQKLHLSHHSVLSIPKICAKAVTGARSRSLMLRFNTPTSMSPSSRTAAKSLLRVYLAR